MAAAQRSAGLRYCKHHRGGCECLKLPEEADAHGGHLSCVACAFKCWQFHSHAQQPDVPGGGDQLGLKLELSHILRVRRTWWTPVVGARVQVAVHDGVRAEARLAGLYDPIDRAERLEWATGRVNGCNSHGGGQDGHVCKFGPFLLKVALATLARPPPIRPRLAVTVQ